MYLSDPIDTKRQGCCTFPLSGSIQSKERASAGQQSTEALGPQGWTEYLQDVSLWCPSPFGSILGVTMSIMHACGHSQELCNDISAG